MTLRQRLVSLALAGWVAAAAGCERPEIEAVSPSRPAADAGAGSRADAGAAGRADAGDVGPGFSVTFPDAGAGAAPPPPGGPGGEGPACAGEVHQGKPVPIDLLLLVDISGSMEESAGARSKWFAVREALQTFARDPRSAGLGVGLQVFPAPARPCQRDGDCAAPSTCELKGLCGPPAAIATSEAACNAAIAPTCGGIFSTDPCTPIGLCAKSGLRCVVGGSVPCPGPVGADYCQARPMFCTDVIGETCNPGRYATAVVPIADLPGALPAIDRALGAVVAHGGTPTTPAVQGALVYLRTRAAANPTRKPVLVLATDGLPTGCGSNDPDTVAAALAAARSTDGVAAISTYVIGVFAPGQIARSRPALDTMARGGGTATPFVLSAASDLSQRFLEAVNQIRGNALACEFTIPRPTSGMLDYDKVNVRFTGAAGAEDFGYVDGGAARCDPVRGGWYYDANPRAGATPTRVRLCPATCARVQSTAGAISLRFGCKTIVIE